MLRLVVEDVLGISEVGRELFDHWRNDGQIVPRLDLDGDPWWDEWCVLACIALDKIKPDWHPSAGANYWSTGPLNARLATANAFLKGDLWLSPAGMVFASNAFNHAVRPRRSIDLRPELEYVREEVETISAEPAFR